MSQKVQCIHCRHNRFKSRAFRHRPQHYNLRYGDSPHLLESGLGGEDATTVSGTLSYQWYSSLNNVTWKIIPGEISASYQAETLTQTTYFRRSAINSIDSNSCEIPTNSIVVQVLPKIEIGHILGGGQILCEGSIPERLELIDHSPNAQVQWEQSFDNIVYSPINGQTSTTLSFTESITHTTHFRAILRTTNPQICVSQQTNVVSITVIPKPQLTQTSGPAGEQLLCAGSPIDPITFEIADAAHNLNLGGLAATGLTLSRTGSKNF